MASKKLEKVWLMVHPGCEGIFTPRDVLEYRRMIDMVARDPKAGFVMAPAFHGKGAQIEESLRRYAQQKIPRDRIAELRGTGKLDKPLGVTQKARIFAFGSYLPASVMECAASTSQELGIARKNVTLLPKHSVHYPLTKKGPSEMGLLERSGAEERRRFGSMVRRWGFNTEPSFQQRLRRLRKR